MRWWLISLIILLLLLTSCAANEDPKQGAIRLLSSYTESISSDSKYLEIIPRCIRRQFKIAHEKLDIPYAKLLKAMNFNLLPVNEDSLPLEEDLQIKQSGRFVEVTYIDKELKRHSFVMVLDNHRYTFYLNTLTENKTLGSYNPTLTPGVSNPPKGLKK